MFLHCPLGWSWAQSCSSQFLGKKELFLADLKEHPGFSLLFLLAKFHGFHHVASKKIFLRSMELFQDDLRKLFFFASESIKTQRVTQREVPTNALHAVHQHHGKDGAIPTSVFAPRKADSFGFVFLFFFHVETCVLTNIFMTENLTVFRISQSYSSQIYKVDWNKIVRFIHFIRSLRRLRNEPWIHGMTLATFSVHLGGLTWLHGKAIFILVLQDVVVLGFLRLIKRERCQ